MYIMYFHHFFHHIYIGALVHWSGGTPRPASGICGLQRKQTEKRRPCSLPAGGAGRRLCAGLWKKWWLYGDLILFSWWFSGDLIVMVIKSVMYHHVSCCLLGFLGLHFSVCKAKHVYAHLLNKSQIDSLAAWSKSRFSFKDSGMLFLNSAAGS